MDASLLIGIVAIVALTLVLALVAAAETALERANDVRIQALAVRGDPRARRIANNVEQPRQFLGPLTVARVLSAAAVVTLFAWLGARDFGPLRGAGGFGIIGALWVTIVQLTVGLLAARQ
ncbi:MAG: CNNM domain-containing protein, partial [Hyphomicrobiales bacterium]